MSNRHLATVEHISRENEESYSPSLSATDDDGRNGANAQDHDDSAIILDDDIAHLIRRAHQRASATFMAVLASHNLTPAQYFALTRLREKGEVSQNLLGRMAAMDPATIQGVVKRLGERGMIARVPDRSDRRRIRLHLTDEGIALIDGLRGGIEEMTGKILAPLNPDERSQLRTLLKRIV